MGERSSECRLCAMHAIGPLDDYVLASRCILIGNEIQLGNEIQRGWVTRSRIERTSGEQRLAHLKLAACDGLT